MRVEDDNEKKQKNKTKKQKTKNKKQKQNKETRYDVYWTGTACMRTKCPTWSELIPFSVALSD